MRNIWDDITTSTIPLPLPALLPPCLQDWSVLPIPATQWLEMDSNKITEAPVVFAFPGNISNSFTFLWILHFLFWKASLVAVEMNCLSVVIPSRTQVSQSSFPNQMTWTSGIVLTLFSGDYSGIHNIAKNIHRNIIVMFLWIEIRNKFFECSPMLLPKTKSKNQRL